MPFQYLFYYWFFLYWKNEWRFSNSVVIYHFANYNWGRLIFKAKSTREKKLYLTISICFNLILLGYFKYAYFFTQSANELFHTRFEFFNYFSQFTNSFLGKHFSVDKLILPVGISFFTFQSISYTIDMYRGKVTPVKNIFDYGFFVCFFPHLVAGPIVKAHDFLYQIYEPYSLNKKEFGMALFWILNGLLKKIVADYIAINFVDRVFDNPNYYTGVEAVMGVFGYSLQIYMDFSGYTDIAIGVALLLGFRLKTNFNSPYKAQNTSDFWQRWHISLSTWLKEYLYIPLGGNREGTIGSYIAIAVLSVFLVMLTGKLWLLLILFGVAIVFVMIAYFSKAFRQSINTNVNLMVTMLLGGLWHGSSWLFIIWGGLNGLGLVIHKLWLKISPFKRSNSFVVKMVAVLVTLTFISFTRIFFRSDSLTTVNLIFDRITNHFAPELFFKIVYDYSGVLSLILIGYLIHWIPSSIKNKYRTYFAEMPYYGMALTVVIVVFVMYQLMSAEMQPFIYFQF